MEINYSFSSRVINAKWNMCFAKNLEALLFIQRHLRFLTMCVCVCHDFIFKAHNHVKEAVKKGTLGKHKWCVSMKRKIFVLSLASEICWGNINSFNCDIKFAVLNTCAKVERSNYIPEEVGEGNNETSYNYVLATNFMFIKMLLCSSSWVSIKIWKAFRRVFCTQ